MTTFIAQPASQSALQEILAHDPMISLNDIRRAHPAFRAMSLDHLGVRLLQAIEARQGSRLK